MSDPTTPSPEEPTGDIAPEPAAAEPTPPAKSAARAPVKSDAAYQSAGRVSPLAYLSFFGILALVAGLIWRYVEKETGVVTNVWIFASLLMILVPLAWHALDFGRAIASRRGQAFGYVATTVALGVAVTCFVGWADVKFKSRLPTWDFTKSSRYSLSEESTKLLAKVEGTVHITYLMQGQADEGLRQAAIEQIRVYEASSPRVRVAVADSIRDPDAAKRALQAQGVATTTTSGEDSDVIVLTYAEQGREVTPGKQKEIKLEKWTFFKTSSTGEDKWLGESVISSSIYELVFQKLKAYATAGHGERLLKRDYHRFKELLSGQNVESDAEALVLGATPKIPDDCNLLLVLAPTTPFTTEEAKAVQSWLDAGDRALFLVVDVHEDRFTTGLDDMLSGYGLHTRCNYEVVAPLLEAMKVDDKQVLVPVGQMSNQFPIYGPSYADHPAVQAFRAHQTIATYFFKSTYVEVDEKPPEGAEPLAVCTAPSFGEGGQKVESVALRHDPSRKNFNSFNPATDKSGVKLPLVATSTRKPAAGKESRIVLSGDSDAFSDDVADRLPANLDLARGLVQWSLRREGLVAVSARTLDDPYVTPTEYQRRFAVFWPLFACLLPLVAGLGVWWSRRR